MIGRRAVPGLALLLVACQGGPASDPPGGQPEAVSLLGEPLIAAPLAADVLERRQAEFERALADHAVDPEDEEAIVWLGRRTAYLNRYREAVEMFSRGIELHPESYRLLRHRGHRYLTLRELDRAIADLERAGELIDGVPDRIEPDGLPNARNEPRSSSHSNIWYHLGLAYYLSGRLEEAAASYERCLGFSTNPDMLSATTHWLYMTLRRLDREEDADELLETIVEDMDVIENHEYYELLLMYKGLRDPEELTRRAFGGPGAIESATLGYGIANWHLYNDRPERARELFRKIINGDAWVAFGHLAAEAELAREPEAQ